MAVLRAIARELNVKSPTEKLKPELVAGIIERRYGIIVVNDKKSKGAKPKANLDVSEYIEEVFEPIDDNMPSDTLTLQDSGKDAVLEEYEVSESVAKADIEKFEKQLLDGGILE